jgi:hypothetical protein
LGVRSILPAKLRHVLVKLLPPGNRPGHEDTPAYRSDDVALDGEATARGATGSAHWQQPGHATPRRWG